VAEELGHSRENITNAYLAGILKQPSDVATPTPAAEVKRAAANGDARSGIEG
jgi:hypothetical protein